MIWYRDIFFSWAFAQKRLHKASSPRTRFFFSFLRLALAPASKVELCNLIFLGLRRRLLHSFVRLAIKNQALRELTCQRHVFFEAHWSLNKKILRYGLFSPIFTRCWRKWNIFRPLLSRRGRQTWSPAGWGGNSRPVLLQTVKAPPPHPPLPPPPSRTSGQPGTQTHLLLTHDWPRANTIVFTEIGSLLWLWRLPDGRRNAARDGHVRFEVRNNQACAVICRASCQQPPTGWDAVKQTFAQGPLSSVFLPCRLSIHFSLCCTLFTLAASPLCWAAV